MSMKKWTDQELLTTRDNLEAVKNRENAGQNSKLGLLTALIGALAISTGVAFIFIDGVDVFTVILIIMGVLTCFSWFRNDKRRRDNIALLSEINKEIKSRKLDESAKKANKTNQQNSPIVSESKSIENVSQSDEKK
ncbi:MAG TPA: hypothetical protein PLV19_07420 [Nitrosomonas sp.]|nr:hypothetical protein [Nitrosomonas sp.]HQU99266.1 hypothetical protein [Nitrosomonas sp.]HQX13987.1 hypothetical protein [Nitrosomonas sp.]HRB31808.1 hypothetical protein [Nitrosomonas sp.]HRB44642.1 hypothetical protein [Nitrosomonas sp.]